MHYKNGRPAQNGDMVVWPGDQWNPPKTGVLHSTQPGSTSCNGRLAPAGLDHHVTVGDCLHADDVRAAAANLPDASAPTPTPVPLT